jgi:hypothetical protein
MATWVRWFQQVRLQSRKARLRRSDPWTVDPAARSQDDDDDGAPAFGAKMMPVDNPILLTQETGRGNKGTMHRWIAKAR